MILKDEIMKTLKIDDKWSVEYDPDNNDRPAALLRHGRNLGTGTGDWSNSMVAMFYALLEAREKEAKVLTIPPLTEQQAASLNMMTKAQPMLQLDLSNERVEEITLDPVALASDEKFTAEFLNALADRIHADNVKAGWWSDLQTGESILHTRNVPELLMLIVSEIAEGMEGHRKKSMDDKLPHRPALQTELADAIIRILDLAGSRTAIEREDDAAFYSPINSIGDIIREKREFNRNRADHQRENRLKAGGKAF